MEEHVLHIIHEPCLHHSSANFARSVSDAAGRPVQTGDRYVLALWFCRKDDDEYEEDPAEQEGKAIYSGAWSSETHPTNTIKIKGIT